jgi:hypothetical protein
MYRNEIERLALFSEGPLSRWVVGAIRTNLNFREEKDDET